ncbi:ATP-binding protein [Streptomyces sp. I05A-00742]|uniref:ATP-binding protein n=1 Tax=Streptomyces sp. I05A-00742 TaxID=2732853 RepID=UPI001489F954|nr:ATP-binding protein [Streptomyces sp. I05A-00742]
MTVPVQDLKLEMTLALTRIELPQVRRFVRLQLRWWGLVEPLGGGSYRDLGIVDDALLVVGELLANVVKHVRDPRCGLSLRVRDGFLHVGVRDDSPVLPALKWQAEDDQLTREEGRGLLLVDRLTEGDWYAERTPPCGKTVRCRLPIPRQALDRGMLRTAESGCDCRPDRGTPPARRTDPPPPPPHWHAFHWSGPGRPTRAEELDVESGKPPAVNAASRTWLAKPPSLRDGHLPDAASCLDWLERKLGDDPPVSRVPPGRITEYARGELTSGTRKLPLEWPTRDGRVVRLMLLACPSRSRAFPCPGTGGPEEGAR